MFSILGGKNGHGRTVPLVSLPNLGSVGQGAGRDLRFPDGPFMTLEGQAWRLQRKFAVACGKGWGEPQNRIRGRRRICQAFLNRIRVVCHVLCAFEGGWHPVIVNFGVRGEDLVLEAKPRDGHGNSSAYSDPMFSVSFGPFIFPVRFNVNISGDPWIASDVNRIHCLAASIWLQGRRRSLSFR